MQVQIKMLELYSNHSCLWSSVKLWLSSSWTMSNCRSSWPISLWRNAMKSCSWKHNYLVREVHCGKVTRQPYISNDFWLWEMRIQVEIELLSNPFQSDPMLEAENGRRQPTGHAWRSWHIHNESNCLRGFNGSNWPANECTRKESQMSRKINGSFSSLGLLQATFLSHASSLIRVLDYLLCSLVSSLLDFTLGP